MWPSAKFNPSLKITGHIFWDNTSLGKRNDAERVGQQEKVTNRKRGMTDEAQIAITQPKHHNDQWRQLRVAGARSLVLTS